MPKLFNEQYILLISDFKLNVYINLEKLQTHFIYLEITHFIFLIVHKMGSWDTTVPTVKLTREKKIYLTKISLFTIN